MLEQKSTDENKQKIVIFWSPLVWLRNDGSIVLCTECESDITYLFCTTKKEIKNVKAVLRKALDALEC